MASSPAPRCSISMPLLSSPSSTGPKPRPPPPARKTRRAQPTLNHGRPCPPDVAKCLPVNGVGRSNHFFPSLSGSLQIFLDRERNHVVICHLILRHQSGHSPLHPRHSAARAFSFTSSTSFASLTSSKSFTIRTSKTPLPQLLYNPHLQAPLGSAGNKGLITPLESALTKSGGGWGSFSPLRNSPHATCHYPLCSSPFFSDYSTLFCTFLHISKTQPICFHAVPRSLRKKHGCGGGHDLPNHKRVLFRSLPESASFDSRSASTYNPAVSSVASQSNFISGSNRMKKSFWACAAGIFVLFGQAARVAAQAPEREAKAPEAKPAEKCDPVTAKEESSVTEHTIKIGGQTIPYKATASTTLLKNEKGESTGLMYSAAYTRNDAKDLSTRPVSFLYNGGPGSATMWLHMGAFGPRRAYTVDGTFTPPAPYKLVDNPESLLDKTDLVFIDAMGTGYSHAVCKAQDKDFFGIDEDIEAFAQF